MGKKRILDRKIRSSQSFAQLTYRQRDLWQGLIVCADDQGRLPGLATFIRSTIWPYDDVSINEVEEDIKKLIELDYIILYNNSDDQIYIQIAKWWHYQQPQWAGPSDHPSPDTAWEDRMRYHAKGGGIVTLNWGRPGGYALPTKLPRDVPSPLPKDETSATEEVKVNDVVKETNDGEKQPPSSKQKRAIQNLVRKSLEVYFIEVTKLPSPKTKTAAQKKSAGALWWMPLREIAELTEWDETSGKVLIHQAIERLNDMTVSNPKSILKTAQAIYSEGRRESPGQIYTGINGEQIQ